LSGGSTPRQTYLELASPRLVDRFPWSRVHWFWGDERFVPADDPESNFRMTREAMLDAAAIPPANIHPIPTVGIDPVEAALLYEAELKRAYGTSTLLPDEPLFHVCLLGLGDDGHIASLIPGEPALLERDRWVAVVAHGRPETRITLTYPAIDASRHIAFLVSGESKRTILENCSRGAVPSRRRNCRPWVTSSLSRTALQRVRDAGVKTRRSAQPLSPQCLTSFSQNSETDGCIIQIMPDGVLYALGREFPHKHARDPWGAHN
jgi:6-phosphogluconolactonase